MGTGPEVNVARVGGHGRDDARDDARDAGRDTGGDARPGRRVLVAVGIGTFMPALDGSVVNTILPLLAA
ncbi:MAG: hypothetical protein ACYC2G_16425 [Gemmatimonadaceae bacterium]